MGCIDGSFVLHTSHVLVLPSFALVSTDHRARKFLHAGISMQCDADLLMHIGLHTRLHLCVLPDFLFGVPPALRLQPMGHFVASRADRAHQHSHAILIHHVLRVGHGLLSDLVRSSTTSPGIALPHRRTFPLRTKIPLK